MTFCSECGTEVNDSDNYCNDCGANISSSGTLDEVESGVTEIDHPANDGFAPLHGIASLLLATIPSIILSIIIPFVQLKALAFLIGLVVFSYLGYQRPTVKSAFGRQSFWSAVFLFLSPLMMIIYASIFASQETEGSAEQAGAAIGGTLLVILAFVIGLPLGIAFYVLHRKFDVGNN